MTTTGAEIRAIRPEEVSAVHELMRQFAIFDGHGDEFKITEDHLFEAYFDPAPIIHCIVALVDNEIIGFINYWYSFSSYKMRRCLWIEDAFINESYRGRGIGKDLFLRIKQISQDNHCARVEWLVRQNNPAGKRFYDRLGAHVDEGTIHVTWPH